MRVGVSVYVCMRGVAARHKDLFNIQPMRATFTEPPLTHLFSPTGQVRSTLLSSPLTLFTGHSDLRVAIPLSAHHNLITDLNPQTSNATTTLLF